MAVRPLQTTIHTDGDGTRFEIYSYRQLSPVEITQEVALYVKSRRRKTEIGRTYRVFTTIGAP
jgi:hypothetical protein